MYYVGVFGRVRDCWCTYNMLSCTGGSTFTCRHKRGGSPDPQPDQILKYIILLRLRIKYVQRALDPAWNMLRIGT